MNKQEKSCWGACEHFDEEFIKHPQYGSYELKPICRAGLSLKHGQNKVGCKYFLKEGVFPLDDIIKK